MVSKIFVDEKSKLGNNYTLNFKNTPQKSVFFKTKNISVDITCIKKEKRRMSMSISMNIQRDYEITTKPFGWVVSRSLSDFVLLHNTL